MLRKIRPILFAATFGLAAAGCQSDHHDHTASAAAAGSNSILRAADMGADVKEAVAMVHGTKGNEKVHGIIKFTDTGNGVRVMAHVTGLDPNSEHGFHIHEFGDCSAPDAAMTHAVMRQAAPSTWWRPMARKWNRWRVSRSLPNSTARASRTCRPRPFRSTASGYPIA